MSDAMTDDEMSLEDALDELSSAEDFLQYFGIEYDPSVVHVNRLHIMQRFHDYLDDSQALLDDYADGGSLDSDAATSDAVMTAVYKKLLHRAYEDFVESDALTEKVFKVFKMQDKQNGFVSLDSLLEG